MPLDGALVATPPAGTTAVPNTVVASAPYNALKDDIYNIFNTKVQPLAGGGSGSATAIGAFDAFNTKGADIATVATVNLDTATGAFDDLTGTTTVTAVTLAAGKHRMTRAAGDFQITVGANLIGNGGGSNVAVKTGDLIIWEGYAGGVVRFWVIPASGRSVVSSAARGYIYGLKLSLNVGDPTNDVDVAVGETATDATTPTAMALASIMTKRTDAAWAVGSGNGGWLDGAAMPNGTGYVFVIQRSDTGAIDVGLSASLTPTLPTNYDRKRYIGSVLREAAALVPFEQYGDEFWRGTPSADLSANNPATTRALRTMSVPVGIRVKAILNITLEGAGGATSARCYVTSPDLNDVAASNSTANVGHNMAGRVASQVAVWTNTSGQIATRMEATSASVNLYINTVGWIDTRGK